MRTAISAAGLACALLALAASPATAQDAKLLERGAYLVNGVVACGNCHLQRDEKGAPLFERGLSGGMVFDEEPFKAHAANITPDPETGIGNWTDAQLAKAIREGIRPDGSVIGPPMPIGFYRGISDDDLRAIVAYLRAQPPVRHAVPKSEYRIPLPPSYGPPIDAKVMAPSPEDSVAYGAYLAGPLGHCMDCHTPWVNGHPDMKRLGAGGNPFPGPWGVSVSRNLTPHETGLKGWSDAEIARAIREGVRKDGTPLKPPMGFGFYKSIDDRDMQALIAYLRSLEPLPFAAPPGTAPAGSGK
ncbi:MAG: c-type cytochrome [Burkholderiales bacterium]|nr:MAG: c-type cytochrome [Burkholderiales bacterium]